MDDNREGCFPESYVLPADAVSTDESTVQQPHAVESQMAPVQAPLVPPLSFVLASCRMADLDLTAVVSVVAADIFDALTISFIDFIYALQNCLVDDYPVGQSSPFHISEASLLHAYLLYRKKTLIKFCLERPNLAGNKRGKGCIFRGSATPPGKGAGPQRSPFFGVLHFCRHPLSQNDHV